MKYYYCPHCKNQLGLTNNKALFIGACIFEFLVTIRCAICKHTLKWRPLEAEYVVSTPTLTILVSGQETAK